MTKIEFFADRKGNLTADGQFIGQFASQDAAADMAVRFAQDNDALYVIYYAEYSV